jgi:hypothetical protein
MCTLSASLSTKAGPPLSDLAPSRTNLVCEAGPRSIPSIITDGHCRHYEHDGAHAPMDFTFNVFVASTKSFRPVRLSPRQNYFAVHVLNLRANNITAEGGIACLASRRCIAGLYIGNLIDRDRVWIHQGLCTNRVLCRVVYYPSSGPAIGPGPLHVIWRSHGRMGEQQTKIHTKMPDGRNGRKKPKRKNQTMKPLRTLLLGIDKLNYNILLLYIILLLGRD